jgi:hypothetical protein
MTARVTKELVMQNTHLYVPIIMRIVNWTGRVGQSNHQAEQV